MSTTHRIWPWIVMATAVVCTLVVLGVRGIVSHRAPVVPQGEKLVVERTTGRNGMNSIGQHNITLQEQTVVKSKEESDLGSGVIRGYVVSAIGEPIAGCDVRLLETAKTMSSSKAAYLALGRKVTLDNGLSESSYSPTLLVLKEIRTEASGYFAFPVAYQPGRFWLSAFDRDHTRGGTYGPFAFKDIDIVLRLERCASVVGQVIDKESGVILLGAVIRLTSEDGEVIGSCKSRDTFAIEGVPKGTYVISAVHPRYSRKCEQNIEVQEGQVMDIVLNMDPSGGTIKILGRISDIQTGQGIDGAEIRMLQHEYRTVSETDGRFELIMLECGTAHGMAAYVSAGGYTPERHDWPEASGEYEWNPTLERLGTLECVVSDLSGRAVRDARVIVTEVPDMGFLKLHGVSDEGGICRVSGVRPASTVAVMAMHPTEGSQVLRPVMFEGDGQREHVILRRGTGVLSVTVIDAEGKPVPHAAVLVIEGLGRDDPRVRHRIEDVVTQAVSDTPEFGTIEMEELPGLVRGLLTSETGQVALERVVGEWCLVQAIDNAIQMEDIGSAIELASFARTERRRSHIDAIRIVESRVASCKLVLNIPRQIRGTLRCSREDEIRRKLVMLFTKRRNGAWAVVKAGACDGTGKFCFGGLDPMEEYAVGIENSRTIPEGLRKVLPIDRAVVLTMSFAKNYPSPGNMDVWREVAAVGDDESVIDVGILETE